MAAEGGDKICPATEMVLMSGTWFFNPVRIEDLSYFLLPLLFMQTIVILAVTRCLAYFLKPYRQPRIVAELLAGILLGPTILGRLTYRSTYGGLGEPPLKEPVPKAVPGFVFPTTSFPLMQTLGFLGLVSYVFLVAVELDLKPAVAMGKKVLVVAAGSIFLPVLVTASAIAAFRLSAPMADSSFRPSRADQTAFVFILSSALSVTAFPVVTRALTEVKVPNPEIGRLVLPSALIGNVGMWMFLAACFAFTGPPNEVAAPMWMMLSGIGFVLVCVYVLRPFISWIMRQTAEGEPVNNVYMGMILVVVMATALGSSAIGFHPVIGAAGFGLAAPKGKRLITALVERVDSFVTGLMLPFLIVMSGLKADVFSVLSTEENEPAHYVLRLICVVVISTLAKVAGSVLVMLLYSTPRSQGLSLGVLMNTTGPVELIILNMGKHEKVLNQKVYTMLLVASLASTAMMAPLLEVLDRNSREQIVYRQRNLQLSGPDSDLRVVACLHTARSVPSIVGLLKLANPTARSWLFVYAVHLVELTSRTAPMLIVHDGPAGRSATSEHVHSEQIVSAMKKYQSEAACASVTSITAVSAFSSMPDNIFDIAENYQSTLIVLPFHKQLTVDGDMEVINPAIRTVNEHVLADAPCSVAVLVDRGLGDTSKSANSVLHVALLFFGGPDDREALVLACRFVEQPSVELTVVRFVPERDVKADAAATVDTISSKAGQRLDDEYIREFLVMHASNKAVIYTEKVVKDCTGTVAAIRSLEAIHDFYVVGNKSGGDSELVAGMTSEFMEFPELGPIGDYLVSADFSATVSVLVVKQHVGEGRAWGVELGSDRRRRSLWRD